MRKPGYLIGIVACVLILTTAESSCGGMSESGRAGEKLSQSKSSVLVAQNDALRDGSRAGDSLTENNDSVKVKLLDLELVDQDGRTVRFKSDVIGDRVAVVIPFYTTCTTSYPILIFMLTQLQTLLGDRLGRDVVLVSVSVDPNTDIPLRLKAYARRQKAKPGWFFLTGDRGNLGQVLWGVGVLYSSNLDEHNHIPITLVGNARTQWRRFHGFPSPQQVLAEVMKSLESRLAKGAKQGP